MQSDRKRKKDVESSSDSESSSSSTSSSSSSSSSSSPSDANTKEVLKRVEKGEKARQRLRLVRKERQAERKEYSRSKVAREKRLRESSVCRESKKVERSNRGTDERERSVFAAPSTSSPSTSSRQIETSKTNSGMNARFGPMFLSRSAAQVEKMVSDIDRVHGGPERRLLLKRVHECNGPIKACKFYNINECNLPYKVHGQKGEEVEHCCSDCLYVVPGMIMRHRAETNDCPLFNCTQRL